MEARLFYSVEELARHWKQDESRIWQWLIEGELRAHAWLPLMSVFRIDPCKTGSVIRQRRELDHWQGYAALNRFHCLRLFKSGRLTLREITCYDQEKRYVIPDEADDLVILGERVVILNQDRRSFEKEKKINNALTHRYDLSFKSLFVEGTLYHFGDMQAAILRRLYECACAGEPWQNGKRLLHAVNSQSFTLANVFQGKPVWRDIIQSNQLGDYRLKEKIVEVTGQY